MKILEFMFLFLIFLSLPGVWPQQALAAEDCGKSCCVVTVKTPPIFVVPTGYDAREGMDAVERKKERTFSNYYSGTTSLTSNGLANGKPLVLPKRTIVQISDTYRDLIERQLQDDSDNTQFPRTRERREWVPVKVLSVPPENKKLQEAKLKSTKAVAKYQYPTKVDMAEVGSRGFVKISDLEKIDKQQDFVFVVKKETELFTRLNDIFRRNDLDSLEPYALRLKENQNGYEVNQCCPGEPEKCLNFPIFEVMNVLDKKGRGVEFSMKTDCFSCQNEIFTSLTPIEENILAPIRKILSHPTLGLPLERVINSISNLNFVDSRGFVQIPMIGTGVQRTGPFNSRHYGAESGDADAYMKPDVACGFMQFLKTWDKTCQGAKDCEIEFGDASHANHKHKIGSPWPHESHTDGECIDINTSRMADKYLGPMMKQLQQLGQTRCLSMEKNILKQGGCTFDRSGVHDTHMHICFPSNVGAPSRRLNNPKLKEACEQGVNP